MNFLKYNIMDIGEREKNSKTLMKNITVITSSVSILK
jgi:hypothetical protein